MIKGGITYFRRILSPRDMVTFLFQVRSGVTEPGLSTHNIGRGKFMSRLSLWERKADCKEGIWIP